MDSSSIHEVSYTIWIRSEYPRSGSPIFRGTLETFAGQQFPFNTLAELNGLLCEIGGWIDTPPSATVDGGQRQEIARQRREK